MKKVNILLTVIVTLLAIFLALLGTGTAQKVQRSVISLFAPFLRTGTAVRQGIGAMGKGLKSLDQLEEDNRRLVRENRDLRATNLILRDMETENNKLRSAMDYRERSIFRLVPAQVITRDASTWWNTVTINRGFEDGVDDGLQGGPPMTVITDGGLVGKVMTAGKNDAKVVLITDENCKVGAYVEGTHEKGIVCGVRVQDTGEPELQMNFLTKNANLQPGQKVYTQGVGAVFPSGLLIGTVKSFKPRELDGQAILTPAVDFPTLADVFVIVSKK
ncbi:MAG: rod shape-determining protein MreC [Terrimicrobiaceae bacterium]|nr:rod shape-determining protein MreC [Terrimicrobiaceae bacterium]